VDYLRLRSCRGRAVVEIIQDLVVGPVILFLIFFAFPLARIAFQGHSFVVIATVVSAVVLPLFSAIVGIAFAIVVDDKVVLVQTTPDHLLVVLFSNFIINIALILNLVRVQSRFACSS
jgi:hypothetical protein